MHKKTEYKVISFYEFINLTKIEQLKNEIHDFLKKKKAKGTILLAREGLNGTISIKKNHSLEFKEFVNKILNKKAFFKTQNYFEHVFLRLKVKIKSDCFKDSPLLFILTKTSETISSLTSEDNSNAVKGKFFNPSTLAIKPPLTFPVM